MYYTLSANKIKPTNNPIKIKKKIEIISPKLKLKRLRGKKQYIEIPNKEEIKAKETRPQGNPYPSTSISILTADDLDRLTSKALLKVYYKADFIGIIEDNMGINIPKLMDNARALPVG